VLVCNRSLCTTLIMADDDPFGMDAPPPAAPTEGGDFGMGDFGEMPPPAAMPSDALPTFDEPPAMPPPSDAAPPMDMGGMDGMMGGGMPDMGGGMPDMGGGMPDMGGGMPDMGGGMMGGGMMGGADFGAPMGELGPVAKWRLEQQERVAAKAAAAQEAEAAKMAEAQQALSTFYAERSEKTTKRAAENRAAEAQYVSDRDASMLADSWESVCKLVDLKEKAGAEVDTSRMRSLLTQLKHT